LLLPRSHTQLQETQFFLRHHVPQWISLFLTPIVAIDLLQQFGGLWDE
jgi:hypothetical protein